jgi:hypothetical protein
LVGFPAGYRGPTRDAYTLDLRQYTWWCAQPALHLFTARRPDIECFRRDIQTRGRARATIPRRLGTVTGSVRPLRRRRRSTRALAGRARASASAGLRVARGWAGPQRVGALLVAAGLDTAAEHPLVSLLAINGLRISEALGHRHQPARPRTRPPHPDCAPRRRQDRHHSTGTSYSKGHRLATGSTWTARSSCAQTGSGRTTAAPDGSCAVSRAPRLWARRSPPHPAARLHHRRPRRRRPTTRRPRSRVGRRPENDGAL